LILLDEKLTHPDYATLVAPLFAFGGKRIKHVKIMCFLLFFIAFLINFGWFLGENELFLD